MTLPITEPVVLDALRPIVDPDFGKSIVWRPLGAHP